MDLGEIVRIHDACKRLHENIKKDNAGHNVQGNIDAVTKNLSQLEKLESQLNKYKEVAKLEEIDKDKAYRIKEYFKSIEAYVSRIGVALRESCENRGSSKQCRYGRPI